MKQSTEYIKEGLFDNVDKLEGKNGLESNLKQLKYEIIDWICSHYYSQPGEYKTHFVKKRDLQINMETTPPTVSYIPKKSLDNRLYASRDVVSICNNGMFQWGEISGDFIVHGYRTCKLEDISGLPKDFNKSIELWGTKLKSLEGIPEHTNSIVIGYCDNLKNLKGLPKEMESIKVSYCDNLTSLEGCPEKVKYFRCFKCHGLTDLKGSPDVVEKEFTCTGCDNLKSVNGLSKKIKGDVTICECPSLPQEDLKWCLDEFGPYFTGYYNNAW